MAAKELIRRLEALDSEVKRLEAALAVYADRGNWNALYNSFVSSDGSDVPGWQVADKALRGGE
jgi:hypothetical protein